MRTQEQQNLIDNLRAPIKSFRIFALEEIIRTGDSPELLAVLQEISLLEDDSECSMLVSHAILAVKERIEGLNKKQGTLVQNTASAFLSDWEKADESKRMRILSDLPTRLPKELRTLGPDLLEGVSPVVAARVIRAFCRYWPEEKLALISEKLYSKSLVLKLAALRTMVHTNPELLLPDLPALLSSDDPEIKALAIRGLIKIDKEEALNHLQALLLSPLESERLAGIQNCPFLSFDMVKPLLLKYFAAENNPELLTKAGWIIEMNPDVEVPFTLFEIAERSPAKKAELIKKVLNESVRLLDKSGILGSQFAAYTKKLQTWVNKRNALRYVKQIVDRLDAENVSPELDKSILAAIKQPLIFQTLKEAFSWPLSELVKARIGCYLGITSKNSEGQSKEDIAKANDSKIDKKEKDLSQIGMLSSITPEKAATRLNQLLLMLSHKGTDLAIKIAVFQCLTRCRLSGAEDIAIKQINNHDVTLATAAVEYLGIVNPDMIFPYLGQCLKVADIGMKSATLGILKNFDFNQAISSLRAMLFATDPQQQRMAMECMNQFDFGLVRDMLTDYLCLDYPESLLEAGLLHFAANPSADNVYSLYKIEQAHKGKISEQAKQLREACQVANEDVEISAENKEETDENSEKIVSEELKTKIEDKKQKQESELKERLRLEKEKQKSKKPDYAYKTTANTHSTTSKQQLIEIWELAKGFVSSKALPISIIVLVVAVIGFYLLFIPRGATVSEQKSSAVVAQKKLVEGTVRKVENGAVTVELTDGEKILMLPRQDGYIIPEIYSKLRMEVVPYRKTSDGTKVVKIASMFLIKQFYNDNKETSK